MNGISDRNAASMVSLKKTYTIGGEEITTYSVKQVKEPENKSLDEGKVEYKL